MRTPRGIPDHAQLFRAVLSGDHLLRGFHNAQIRQALWGQHLNADQRRRQVLGALVQLHYHGLATAL